MTNISIFLCKTAWAAFLFLGGTFFLDAHPGFAADAGAKVEADWAKTVAAVVSKSKIPNEKLGLVIAKGDDVLVDVNGSKQMIPASLTKVATSAAVLSRFPVGHQFLTELRSAAAIEGGHLKGDLCLVGGGDAGFVSESLWQLVNEFLRSNVKTIEGNIRVDDSLFDSVRYDESRDQDRVDRAYDSPIGAMTFNWSAVNVFVRPGDKAGASARVWTDPENDYFTVENKATTKSSGGTKIQVERKGLVDGKEKITVNGTIALNADEFVAYKAVTQPEIFAGRNLVAFLKSRGVSVSGKVVSGTCPFGAKLLAKFKSRPISDLTSSMMKFSNNYIAEILTKNLSVQDGTKPGTMKAGVKAIADSLLKMGLKKENFVLQNPSGLSRTNRFRALDLVKILSYMHGDFRLFPEFIAGFPISGVDGTLRRKNLDDALKGSIRAKTGHLTGVSGLAGYFSGPDSNIYEFAFVYNGNADEAYRAKDLFDQILKGILSEK